MKHPISCGLGADHRVCQALESGNCNLVAFCRMLNGQPSVTTELIWQSDILPAGRYDNLTAGQTDSQTDGTDTKAASRAGWRSAGILANLGEMG